MRLPDTNWFDLVVVVMLVIGLIRGRMRGMSAELLPLLQWLLILVVGAHTYEPVGRLLHTVSQLKLVYCNVAVYLFVAALLKWLFTALKHLMGDKLLSADAFGKGEYFIGMFGGAARFACMVMVCLALLHAFYVPEPPRAADAKPPPKTDTSFLDGWTLASRQQDVFSRSFLGPVVRRHLSTLLIRPGAPPAPTMGSKIKDLREKRGRLLDETINPK
jgi:uncharacterized membrane protein required for colicin V production